MFAATFAMSQTKVDSLRVPRREITKNTTGKVDSLTNKLNSRLDSISHLSVTVPGDSTMRGAMHKADSIRSGFKSKADSLQLAFRKPLNKVDSLSRSLKYKIDSLTKLKLPTTKLTHRLDSINKISSAKLAELNQKLGALKQKATKDLNALELPPQLKEPVQKLTQSISGYNIPMVNGKIPGIDPSLQLPQIGGQLPTLGTQLPGNLNTSLPGNLTVPGVSSPVNGQVPGVTNPAGIANPIGQLSNISSQVNGYGQDAKNIAQGNISQVKNLDKAAEKELMKSSVGAELKGKTAEVDQMKKKLATRPDSAAVTMVKQEVMKEATNHFKGQEAVLTEAMDKLSKLKTKYSDVKSMADLPKKLPNPLHDKPFIERIVPGITFQIISTGALVLDANAGAMYKISPRLSAGAGWVERLIFDTNQQNRRMYGPRAAVQFDLRKGFGLRFVPEFVNAYIPPQLQTPIEGTDRQWVWGALVGLKKEFKVYKNLRGNTEALYNLYNPNHMSPYRDQLVVRFGFEFQIKKKVKE